jgi:cell division protein FtsA
MEAARAVVIPMDRQILEVIPQNYIVDAHRGIRDPLDMMGGRLEAEVHIITCSGTGAQNIAKCVERARFAVNDLILQSLAAAQAVLTPDEKELGVVLIDLGGGTTDVLVFSEGAPYTTATIAAGGTQVTNDISILKNIPYETAEKIKLDAGCCWEPFLEEDDDIIIPGVGGRAPLAIPKSQIMAIIKPRMEEIFKMVKEKLEKLSLPRPLGGGVVITGGGAQLSGVAELASEIFNLPVRVGSPLPVGGLVEEYRNPAYATALGLVLTAYERERKNIIIPGPESRPRESFLRRIIDWFKKEFF